MLKKNLSESYSQSELDLKFQAYLVKHLRISMVELIKDSLLNKKRSLHQLNINNFFEFIVQLVDQEMVSKFDLFVIFEDLFESSPESTLEELFSLME